MILGIAMRDGNGVLITVGHIGPCQGKTGGVEMVEARIDAFLETDRQGQFAQQQVAAVAVGFVEVRPSLKRLNISARTS